MRLLLTTIFVFSIYVPIASGAPFTSYPASGTTVYKSATAFAHAAPDFTKTNFNSIPLTDGTPPETYSSFSSLPVGDATFTGIGPVDVAPADYYARSSGILYPEKFLVPSIVSNGHILNVGLTGTQHAVAIDFGSLDPGVSSSITLSDGTRVTDKVTANPGSTEFLGFTSSNPITSLHLAVGSGGSAGVYILKDITTSGATPPRVLPTKEASTVNFPDFPLAKTNSETVAPTYNLVTQVGGWSRGGSGGNYLDKNHTGGGYYSIDIEPTKKANVVAAKSGIVILVDRNYQAQGDKGPVVEIYNGNGYITDYREFTKNPTVKVGDYVHAGQKIGVYEPNNTNGLVDPGSYTALHFQVKYIPALAQCPKVPNPTCTPVAPIKQNLNHIINDAYPGKGPHKGGIGFSTDSAPLRRVTLAGKPLASPTYKFDGNHNKNYSIRPQQKVIRTHDNSQDKNLTLSFSGFDATNAITDDSTAELIEHSPAYLWEPQLTLPSGTKYMSFDYNWKNPGDGDYLSVFLGKTSIFSSVGLDFSGTDFVNSGPISMSAFAGTTNQFLFWLNSVGSPNADIMIKNVTFYGSDASSVPEPGSLLLLSTALLFFGVVGWSCKRRSIRTTPSRTQPSGD